MHFIKSTFAISVAVALAAASVELGVHAAPEQPANVATQTLTPDQQLNIQNLALAAQQPDALKTDTLTGTQKEATMALDATAKQQQTIVTPGTPATLNGTADALDTIAKQQQQAATQAGAASALDTIAKEQQASVGSKQVSGLPSTVTKSDDTATEDDAAIAAAAEFDDVTNRQQGAMFGSQVPAQPQVAVKADTSAATQGTAAVTADASAATQEATAVKADTPATEEKKADAPAANTKPTKELDAATIALLNDNGIVKIYPKFDLAQPAGTQEIIKSPLPGEGKEDSRYIFYGANKVVLRQSDVYRSSFRHYVEKVVVTDPASDGKSNQTATAKVDTNLHGSVKKIDVVLFDGKKEKIRIDRSFFLDRLEELKVERLWYKKNVTKVEIDHTITGKIDDIEIEHKAKL
ncbi:hypothetical protein BDF19DRAFT_455315 [Syncephalis fuscata]|nr:hypothetical protein BDF19DRAFT_455315 [Syncephalis fuscata]